MKLLSRIAIATSIALVASTALARVSVDYEKSVDFLKFKTYAWLEGTPAPTPMAEKRIRSALDAELSSKGLKRVEGDADIYLVTHAKLSVQKHVTGTTSGYGAYNRGGWATTSMSVHEVPVGTLVVDMVDRESNELVWRSIGTDTVSNKVETNEKRLKKVVRKMFKKFPPTQD